MWFDLFFFKAVPNKTDEHDSEHWFTVKDKISLSAST